MSARAEQVRRVLHALADEGRLAMITKLADAGEDLPCGELNRGVPRSTASYHFATLRDCGLITQYDRGNHRYNHLERERMEELAPGLLDAVLAAVSRG